LKVRSVKPVEIRDCSQDAMRRRRGLERVSGVGGLAAAIDGMTDCAAAGAFGIHAFNAAVDLQRLGRAWDLPRVGGVGRCD
jgi:hypothetical protein